MNLSPEQQHPDGLGHGAAPAAEDDGDGKPTGNITFYSKFAWAGKRTQDIQVCFYSFYLTLPLSYSSSPQLPFFEKLSVWFQVRSG